MTSPAKGKGVLEIAAIVVHYGGDSCDLQACCAALRASQRVRQVIVVDNASPCPAPDLDGVEIVRMSHNSGLAAGTRAGVERLAASVDGVLLLNPDVVVTEAALEELAAALAAPGVGIVGPRLIDHSGRDQFAARTAPSLPVIVSRRTPASRTRIGARLSESHLAPSVCLDIEPDWLVGACLLVRRDIANRVGWLDERYFLYFEDVDFCLRVRAAGYRVRYVPSAVVSHRYRRASGGRWDLSPAQRHHIVSAAKFFVRYPTLLWSRHPVARLQRDVAYET